MLDDKGGEGASMLDLGEALDLGGACDLFLLCETSCIHVYFHALSYLHVMVRLCDMCALYIDLYIYHVTWLSSFVLLLHFYSYSNELYFMY